MKVDKLYLIVLFILLVTLGACAPKAAPTPASAQATPQMVTTAPAPVAQSATSDDIAWEKVLAEAKKEGKVTAYTYDFPGDVGQALSKAFQDKYGIKIEFVTGSTAFLIERIKTEQAARKNTADTFDTGLSMVLTAKLSGLTEKVGYLPALKDRSVFLFFPRMDAEDHIIGMGSSYSTPLINTKLVGPGEEPRSWNDLLDPRWKNKIVMQNPNITNTPPYIQAVLVDKYKVLDKDYFKKLAANNVKIVPTSPEVTSSLVKGESAVAITGTSALRVTAQEGAPIKAVVAIEGAYATIVPAISAVKGAPHPNAARVFINWLLSKEGQMAWATAAYALGVRSDISDFTPEPLRFKPTKVFIADIELSIEADRLMREGVIGKMMGIER